MTATDQTYPWSEAADLSVVIVSWNAVDYLRQCLASLMATSLDCVRQIIVVDNDSADGSADMVEREFPEVTLVRTGANLGFGRANNVGIAMVSTPYVALVNSDAVVHPGCLQTLQGYLAANPDVGLVGPRVIGGDSLPQATCRRLPNLWNLSCRALALDRVFSGVSLLSGFQVPDHLLATDTASDAEVISGCFCVARMSMVDEVGAFDEQFFFYGEDIDWCRRIRASGWQLRFVPRATATHFGGGSTANAPLRYSVEILAATSKYWGKHHGPVSRAVCHSVLVLHHGLRLALRWSSRWLRSLWRRRSVSAAPVRDAWKQDEDRVCLRWLLGRHKTRMPARSGVGEHDDHVAT